MADSDGDAVLVDKSGTKLLIWKHFGLISDQKGKGVQPENPVCRICHNRVQAKTGNTSNLLSHLRKKHARHYRELRAQMEERAVKSQSSQLLPALLSGVRCTTGAGGDRSNSQMPSQTGSQKMGCPCIQLKKWL